MSKSFSVKLIKLANNIFPPVVHPFNLANDGKKSYAMWQYEKGENTIAFFKEKYPVYKMFENKRVLDVGCGAGGKSLYYASLGAEHVTGIDILPSYEKDSSELAKKLGLENKFHFVCASADNLPYPDGSFDTIIMNDAMEHVSKPEAVLNELLRVLSEGGRIYLNFPPYNHPFGAHLSDGINMPWVHCFFSEQACIDAYRELVADKPDAKERLSFRFSTDKNGRDYISYINKMTIKRFRNILSGLGINAEYYAEIPLRGFLKPLAKLPFTKEFFVKMVVCVISKKA